jgi:small subunit ribosomal protein S5
MNERNNRASDEGGELQEKVVHIRRVAKTVKGGRNMTFNALVVLGDGQGQVGAGLGKGAAVPDAVRQGNTIARKEMFRVPMVGSTVPHAVRASFGASEVLIRPGLPGSGIKAGGGVRAVMEAAGIRDVVCKALGSRNPINVVKATLVGLAQLQGETGEEIEQRPSAVLPPAPERRGPVRRDTSGEARTRSDRPRRGGDDRPRAEQPAAPVPPAADEGA